MEGKTVEEVEDGIERLQGWESISQSGGGIRLGGWGRLAHPMMPRKGGPQGESPCQPPSHPKYLPIG